MFSLHATKKLLERVKAPVEPVVSEPTTALGNWYGTVLFWRPQVALWVNEETLYPVLMPLAPAAILMERIPEALGRIMTAHGVDVGFVDAETAEMNEGRYAKTASRSVLKIMNEFRYLAEAHRASGERWIWSPLRFDCRRRRAGLCTSVTSARTENLTRRWPHGSSEGKSERRSNR